MKLRVGTLSLYVHLIPWFSYEEISPVTSVPFKMKDYPEIDRASLDVTVPLYVYTLSDDSRGKDSVK